MDSGIGLSIEVGGQRDTVITHRCPRFFNRCTDI